MARYTVAVAGATGYAGGEALRILAAHPDFEVTCVAGHSSVEQKLGRHMPHIPQLADLTVEDTTAEVLNGHDVNILARPGRWPRSLTPVPWSSTWVRTIVLKSAPRGTRSTEASSSTIGRTACPS